MRLLKPGWRAYIHIYFSVANYYKISYLCMIWIKSKLDIFFFFRSMRSLKPGAMKKLFGTPIRSEFALDTGNDLVFCNHGSYGATPKRVLQKR